MATTIFLTANKITQTEYNIRAIAKNNLLTTSILIVTEYILLRIERILVVL